jgi:hypothetical protein
MRPYLCTGLLYACVPFSPPLGLFASFAEWVPEDKCTHLWSSMLYLLTIRFLIEVPTDPSVPHDQIFENGSEHALWGNGLARREIVDGIFLLISGIIYAAVMCLDVNAQVSWWNRSLHLHALTGFVGWTMIIHFSILCSAYVRWGG